MSIDARLESWDGQFQKHTKCYPNQPYHYADKHADRLLLARPLGVLGGNVVLHSRDGYRQDIDDMTPEEVRALFTPDTLIDEIMPWSSRSYDVFDKAGGNAQLTIKNLPLIVYSPVKVISIE